MDISGSRNLLENRLFQTPNQFTLEYPQPKPSIGDQIILEKSYMIIKAAIQVKKLTKAAGSKESLKELCQGRILQWEKILSGLNIGDHPEEIGSICSKIIATKELLNKSGSQETEWHLKMETTVNGIKRK